jgi:hypothetical protein
MWQVLLTSGSNLTAQLVLQVCGPPSSTELLIRELCGGAWFRRPEPQAASLVDSHKRGRQAGHVAVRHLAQSRESMACQLRAAFLRCVLCSQAQSHAAVEPAARDLVAPVGVVDRRSMAVSTEVAERCTGVA